MESRRIPEGFDYAAIPQLSKEARAKLSAIQPGTLGQASRVSGVTPADIAVLMVRLTAMKRKREGKTEKHARQSSSDGG